MTVFSVQRFLEDHLNRRGLTDIDDYAIRVANVFERLGGGATQQAIVLGLSRIRTAFFRRNPGIERRHFEASLAAALRRRFPKKKAPEFPRFEGALGAARRRVHSGRRSIGRLLAEFKRAVEARAVDAFWESRRRAKLRSRPEKTAQTLLAVFAKGVLGDSGLVLREVASGIGFVDVAVAFGRILHLVELKVIRGAMTGASQLASYMATEGRNTGWLVLIDTRARSRRRTAIPGTVGPPGALIRTMVVDVNPVPPHAR